ncbi:MAG: hypothetical protein Q9163_004536 [Psora crenata]
MYTRSITSALVPAKAATKLSQAAYILNSNASKPARYLEPCTCYCISGRPELSNRRNFVSTSRRSLKEFFPEPHDNVNIKVTPPAWHHPVYTEQQMRDIRVAHRETKNWKDWIAIGMVRLFRTGSDIAMGYSHPTEEAKRQGSWLGLKKIKSWVGPSPMTERKWLIRFLFLESVAGVPGMVAGSVRHLHSLRRLNRDNGWIETLLEEAYNERMHLLTFMKMAEPGWFMKIMIIGAQGVFYNGFFLSYLLAPSICHRFVGYLEEEAVLTYTRAIEDIEAGKLPKWEKMQAPEIAVRYWNMPEGHRTMKDLILYVRADEAKHREVNHTLGNLEQKTDPNPFVSEYQDLSKPHPTKGIENIKSTGWERQEVI